MAFRKATKLTSEIGPTTVWLRQGEIEGEKLSCKPFDKGLLLASLPTLRQLTIEKDPTVFLPKLTKVCASFGAAVVFVKPFSSVPVYGASIWMNPEKALIQLSLRGKTADILWFTFFHEFAHVLKPSKKEIFVEIERKGGERSEEEIEADEFLSETLIPGSALGEWLGAMEQITADQIIQFAEKQAIAPGIVVGRLQHLGKLPYFSLNNLKCRYTWTA